MATFQAQVEGITQLTVGTTPTTGELTQFLTDGVIEVTNRIISVNPLEMPKFTISTTDSANNGVTVEGQVLSVVREHDSATILRPCTQIDPMLRYEATDTDSLSYRSKYNPGFYSLNGKIFLVPVSATSNNGAIVTQVNYPTVAFGDSSIASGASDYKFFTGVTATLAAPTVLTKASHTFVNGDIVKLSGFTQATELNGITGIVESVAGNNFSIDGVYVDGAAETTGGTVETVVGGFPDEYEYLVVLYASLRTISANMGAKTITAQALTPVTPDIPVVPNFTITLAETLPTYTKLITSYDPGDPTDLSVVHPFSQTVTDIVAFTGITAVAPDSPSLTAMAFTGAGEDASVTAISTDNANVASLEDPGEGAVTLPTAPTYVPPAPPDRPDFEGSVTAEDVEIVGAKAQQYQTDLGAYQAEMSDAVNEFNEANALYQAGIQKAMADAQQDNAMITQSLQKNLTIAQADAAAANSLEQANKAAAMQNAVTDMQEIVNQNNSAIQEWQQGVAAYQAEVGTEVQDYQTKLAKYSQEIQKELTVWQQERQGEIQEHGQKISRFQALVGDELNAFNTELQKYQAEVTVKLQEAQYEQQAEHAAQLQQYQAEVATYGAEVNAAVQEYQNNLQAEQARYAWLQDQYTRLKTEYEAAFVALAPPKQAESGAGARARA